MSDGKKQCCSCEEGLKALKLDAYAECPYMILYGKDGCKKYKPIGGGDKKCES